MNRRLFLSAIGAPLAALGAPAPTRPAGGAVVLDDRDEVYRGKAGYEDHLTFLDGAGKVVNRVSGLNICQEIGSPRRLAVDAGRKSVWVCETVGGRLLRYGLDGKQLLALAGVNPTSVAIDPKTGHAWVVCGEGRIGAGRVDVFDPAGTRLASHDVPGYDIAHDPRGDAFWVVGPELIKLSRDGKPLVRQRVAEWCAVTVAVDPKAGTVWVGERRYDAMKGEDAVKGFNGDGTARGSKGLATGPMRLAVDPDGPAVWVTQGREVVRLSADLKTRQAFAIPALSLDVQPRTGTVWVVTAEDVRRLDRDGKELSRTPLGAKTQQAWIAAWGT
ncbi:MAG: hypothetical protein ACRC33_00230 [Gemmataceae bacterium]